MPAPPNRQALAAAIVVHHHLREAGIPGAAFAEGATGEEIAQQYPSISLADVYQVIGYCLRHSSELEPYLARRRQDINETRRSNESRWPPAGIRDRLLARRQG